MKVRFHVDLKVMLIMLVSIASLSGLIAWFTNLGFWTVGLILVVSVVLNGIVAGIEDGDFAKSDADEPNDRSP